MSDPVNHPTHYADGWSNGAEVIDITENLNFNLGNSVKYIARAGKKDPDKTLEDLQKAAWYLEREINRFDNPPTYNVVDWDEFWSDFDQKLAAIDTRLPAPRLWDSLADVPHGVQVTDRWGDVWTHKLGSWGWFFEGDTEWFGATYEPESYDKNCTPFTEVLETA